MEKPISSVITTPLFCCISGGEYVCGRTWIGRFVPSIGSSDRVCNRRTRAPCQEISHRMRSCLLLRTPTIHPVRAKLPKLHAPLNRLQDELAKSTAGEMVFRLPPFSAYPEASSQGPLVFHGAFLHHFDSVAAWLLPIEISLEFIAAL